VYRLSLSIKAWRAFCVKKLLVKSGIMNRQDISQVKSNSRPFSQKFSPRPQLIGAEGPLLFLPVEPAVSLWHRSPLGHQAAWKTIVLPSAGGLGPSISRFRYPSLALRWWWQRWLQGIISSQCFSSPWRRAAPVSSTNMWRWSPAVPALV
jgi:hypothetical protein